MSSQLDLCSGLLLNSALREGVSRLTVEVSEKQSDKRREVIQEIYNAMMQDMAFRNDEALAVRKTLLHWH